MSIAILNEKEYYRIVYGGWLGKNIGGTLGAPVEGKKELLDLDFYPVLPEGPLENDDLDLQLVWLHALEQYGPGLTARELGQEWLDHIFFPFDEYGYALTNLRRGLVAPLCGSFNNPFTNCMGSPIRSEIWAMAAPGAPDIAVKYAYEDAIVDHAGGEGVYGEMFFAAIESAIFMEKDRDKLIAIGMAYIPAESRTAKALRDLFRWHKEGKNWIEARELILEYHGNDNFTDAPQNIAFTILGWLYGENFEDAILKAVNCGYDTDCTAATLGAILGMLLGPEQLPQKWVSPVGDRVVVSPPINGFPAPQDLDELTSRTIQMGKQVLAYWNKDIVIHAELETKLQSPSTETSEEIIELWNRNVKIDRRLLPRSTAKASALELIIDYGAEGPAIARNASKQLTLTLTNHSLTEWIGELSLVIPSDWSGSAAQPFKLAAGSSAVFVFNVQSSSIASPSYELQVVIAREHDRSPWMQIKESIYLVAAAEWLVQGPEDETAKPVVLGGNAIEWSKAVSVKQAGSYSATTMIHNDKERVVRIITATDRPISAKLNDIAVINSPNIEEFMPAYHRAHSQQFVELTLPVGSHKLEITVQKDDQPLQVYVLPVAGANTEQPGPYYYYTDILFYNK